ncbi:DUF2334 domain-containing protein [Corynebacterium epidermidicanis]|uniref:DUF2334 domain-containing protein n=1 Tax=Corynebacterium epidermidicanis TaxID=1050174 RepID=A0A0G3GMQ6_9CORY|nr:DUF2334 domain-containing protein [Corynebacterium epidermidicanis]AKK02424.1 hypothetical protein CEPID_02720 [Corynebacterium epidermidicanis]
MEAKKLDQKRQRTNVVLGVVVALSVLVATIVIFSFTDRDLEKGTESALVRTFVQPYRNTADIQGSYQSSTFSSTYGTPGGKRTLVLYDDSASDSEVLGILAANLATHFGTATVQPIGAYTAGQIADFDAVVYQGYDYNQVIPDSLRTDIRTTEKPVLWANANLRKLAGPAGSPEAAEFVEHYGIDPHAFTLNEADKINTVRYKGQELSRNENSRGMQVPAVVKPELVRTLGEAVCDGTSCTGTEHKEFPWATQSGNLIYVADLPFEWQENGSHYLAYADLFYEMLDPHAAPSAKAAVRIEDVSPKSNPADLRRVADYLGSRGIPFQVAVVPIYIGPKANPKDDRAIGLELKDTPEVVEALKYMESKGGELIQHGTTHQFGNTPNPYPGAATTADYEFIRSQCSTTNTPPWTFEDCQQNSWVQLTGPLIDDRVSDHTKRIEVGKRAFEAAGLRVPEVFETPHYGATPNAYEAMGQQFAYRYEQTEYYAGLVSGQKQDFRTSLTQILPYRVTDVYGATVLPENIGNPSIEDLNNHAARPPALLVDNAAKNQVVRQATASFFFHPFLDTALLAEIVDGIEGLGYEFVPAREL